MVLNHLSSKTLLLYGILDLYTDFTVDSDSLMVNKTVEIAYNLSDIEAKITQIETEIADIDEEEIDEEVKMHRREDLMEVLEVLTVIKDKLNG